MNIRIACILALSIIFSTTSKTTAQTGLVDDFEGNKDAALTGTYAVFGNDIIGPQASGITNSPSHSPTNSRFLEQSLVSSKGFGVVAIKTFNTFADVRAYAGGTLSIWFYSATDLVTNTFDVNLAFDVGGTNVEYTLQASSEPTLASAFLNWKELSIPVVKSAFEVEPGFGGPFDLTRLKQMKFYIRNNVQPTRPDATIFFDDIQFTASTDTTPPTISFIDPPTNGHMFASATPTLTGSLMDDDLGVDAGSLSLSIDGVVQAQSNIFAMGTSFSFTAPAALSEGVTHTALVSVADFALNSQSTSTTFSIDSSLPSIGLLNPSFEFGDGTAPANWDKFGISDQANTEPRTGSFHGEVSGNNTGIRNFTGFSQTLPASPGQIWEASAYAKVGTPLVGTNRALVQLVFVDDMGDALPGGTNDSTNTLDSTTGIAPYQHLSVQGRAPATNTVAGAKIVLLFIQENDDAGVVYYDDAELLTNAIPTSLTVSPSSVDFGTLMPGSENRRFQTPPLTCDYSVASETWSIEVSSVNPNDIEGMVAPDGVTTMSEFKFWQENFGPGDEEVNTNWTGATASFKRIFSSTNTFKSTLASSEPNRDTPPPFDFTLAVEAAGAFATNYSADVLFELIVE